MKKSKTSTFAFTLGVILIAIIFSGCADVTPIQECITDKPYGFWSGLWHGFIAPISFVASLFMEDIAMWS